MTHVQDALDPRHAITESDGQRVTHHGVRIAADLVSEPVCERDRAVRVSDQNVLDARPPGLGDPPRHHALT